MADRCQAETKRGTRCTATPVPGDDRCAWHTSLPEWAARRQRWSAEGGRKRSNRERAKKTVGEPLGADELAGYLSLVFRGLISGKIDPPIATAAANVARTIRDIGGWAAVEARLDRLERSDGRPA